MPNKIPSFDQLMNPLLQALQEIGGSGNIQEINERLIDTLDLPEELLDQPHNPTSGNQTELEYRLAWTRTYLKKFGILENSKRGVYSLRWKGDGIPSVDPDEVKRVVKEQDKEERQESESLNSDSPELSNEEPEEIETWREHLGRTLSLLEPAAFERLIMRLLRESGFSMVEVTAQGPDGGIDGKGIAKIHGFLSFHVLFQCKRYQGSVGANLIRDFRGAMMGRADKGLFVTTGSFTRDAIKEATRDGASPIDLMDGDQLIEKLRQLGLGVKIEVVERVTVSQAWFDGL